MFDPSKQCFFCGANNENQGRGYGGERCCSKCGKGGFGEPDEPEMAYKKEPWVKEEDGNTN